MKRLNRIYASLAVLIIAALACNMPSSQSAQPTSDPNLAFTAVALTVGAQLTQSAPTATTIPPTSQPPTVAVIPSNTVAAPTIAPPTVIVPTATQECDKAQFIDDVTIPDGTPMSPGEAFTKTWRIRNIGTCTWSGYTAVFDNGNAMGGTSVAVSTTPPGGYVDISVDLTAPASDGTYRGYWRIRNTGGILLPVLGGHESKSFYVEIKVGSGGSSGGPFAVIHLTYSLSTWSDASHTNCPRVTAQITTNGPGTVTYKWTRADNPSGGAWETLTFGSATTKTVTLDWARGSTWAGTPTWVGIYVDDPNHQDFGHKNFTAACTVP